MKGIKTLAFLLFLSIPFIYYFQPHPAPDKNILFQYSTLSALQSGLLDGALSVKSLKTHGNFALGTFNALDGELIELDNQVYQIKSTGQVLPAPDSALIPFALATHFAPTQKIPLPNNISLPDLLTHLDALLPSKNQFYALKITGRFSRITTRSVPAQAKPYPSLSETVKKQSVFEARDVEGAAIGFRCPDYASGINLPGYHFHFLSADHHFAGHLLDCHLTQAAAEIAPLTDFHLLLPPTPDFLQAHLSPQNISSAEQAPQKH